MNTVKAKGAFACLTSVLLTLSSRLLCSDSVMVKAWQTDESRLINGSKTSTITKL